MTLIALIAVATGASALAPSTLRSTGGSVQLRRGASPPLFAALPEGRARAWMQASPTETKGDCVAPVIEDGEDLERVRTVCVALLSQSGKMEELMTAGELARDMDFPAFSEAVDLLEVQCSDEDKDVIFRMIDRDCGGTIDAAELKAAVRSSGAISTMYENSIKTFSGLLTATLAFAVGVAFVKGPADAFDFLTAYVVEDSLSVDNLFVFLLLFRYFKVPPQLVDTCLNYGITGSIFLRGIFIFAGLAAVQAFKPLYLAFSAFLLYSSYSLIGGGEEDEEEDDEPPEIITNLLDKLPLTGGFEGQKFVVQGDDGKVQFTQLTATFVCLALCDILFAVDSIPAVLAVNSDPFIVYTSNIAAVVGLRSLYQLLSVAVSDLVYLEKAVAIVLGFVGLKLGLQVAGVEISSGISLGVIITTLSTGVIASQFASEEQKDDYNPSPSASFLNLLNTFTGSGGDSKKDGPEQS